ncbi:oligodendrocyte-myelin glycoprotein-like [Synchiropus picturatus]
MRRRLLTFPLHEVLLELLLVLLLVSGVLTVCPSACTCNRSHREVDCSWRGLRFLPDGLQHNLRSLNLSHNRFHHLDEQLTSYTHLRVLDLSHNRLNRLPSGLPRSLWHLYAASNRIQVLDKNDTAYQWNLQTLDVSDNRLERAIFINNTLINLSQLNMSYNHFWTLPTNMPTRLETIDLSNNLLVQVLPGSLDRLHKLTHFYLHSNRFSMLPTGVLDQLVSLRVLTLFNNPWTCHIHEDLAYLVSWAKETRAHVLGCPCHAQPACGWVRPGWHFASHNMPPVTAYDKSLSVTGWWHPSSPATPTDQPSRSTGILQTIHHFSAPAGPAAADNTRHADFISERGSLRTTVETSSIIDTSFVTETPTGVTLVTDRPFATQSSSMQTKKTTTLRTRSVRRKSPSSYNSSLSLSTCSSLTLNLLFLILVL